MSEGLLIATVILGFLIIFPAFWSLIVWLVGIPWRGLAADYPAASWPEDGYRLSMQSVSVGLANYGNSLTVVGTDEGLYLRPMWAFRVGHPPIHIPWGEVERVESAFLFGKKVRLSNGQALTVHGRLAKSILAAVEAHDEALHDAALAESASGENPDAGPLNDERRPPEESRRRSRTRSR